MNGNSWIDLIIALFGGGVLGSLVTFFVSRHDKRKDIHSSFYRKVYDYLSKYNRDLYSLLNDFNIYVSSSSDNAVKTMNDVETLMANQEALERVIKRQERKCKKSDHTDKTICNQCKDNREKLGRLSREIIDEQNRLQVFLKGVASYWEFHLLDLKKLASENSNLFAVLSSNGSPRNDIKHAIDLVDYYTLRIICLRMQDLESEFEVAYRIIDCINAVDQALNIVAKEI